MNRKAFRDGIKPGWHYFGRKMVSGGRTQSFLATGDTVADRWRSRAGLLLLTHFCKVHVTHIFLPKEAVMKRSALQRSGCSALCAARQATSACLSSLGFYDQAEVLRSHWVENGKKRL